MYNEKLRLQHLLGMILIVISVLIVSVCKSIGHNVEGDKTTSKWAIMVPISIVFINCLLLTLASFAARASKAIGYRPMQFVADFSFVAGLLYILGFGYYQFFSSDPYSWSLTLFMTLAGFVINLAFLFLN